MNNIINQPELQDEKQRQLALDISQSFIIQAPAGSGKTTLLIKRLVKLIDVVNKPEEILAITFTKKAANEMRERLLQVLKDCVIKSPHNGAHVQKKYEQYQAILQNPNRLNILTIDAFNARLNKQLPILSRLGTGTRISDNADEMYQQAVAQLFTDLRYSPPWQSALQTLLLHCDNQFQSVQQLLVNLLQKRDQWLAHLFDNEKNQRQHLEQALLRINLEALKKVEQLFSKSDKQLLLNIISFAQLHSDNPKLLAAENIFNDSLSSKNTWLAACELLLTQKNEWRKQFNKKIGLVSKDDDKSVVTTAKHYKTMLADLQTKLQSQPDALNTLSICRLLPPANYSEKQWRLVSALSEILPLAYAQLKVIFSQQQQIDYTENAQAALHALGDNDNITDLALALDYRLQHILVDEFQDTAISQLRLLEKLTLNWQADEGKTLFIVGDPMQSIYRFREADVSIFLYVKQHGINAIKPRFLALSSNFRSEAPLINWINSSFSQAFPKQDDINLAAVRYSPATAICQQDGEVQMVLTNNQTSFMLDKIKYILANSEKTIAILVRAKSHLQPIIAALTQAKIGFEAVDLEPLAQTSLIYDALSLCKALHSLADRSAWLALLRAPFIGLSLADLEKISQAQFATIFEGLCHANLSADGQKRQQFVCPVLQNLLAKRQRHTTAVQFTQAWQALNAPHYYHSPQQQNNVQRFINALNQYQQAGLIHDWQAFSKNCQRLFAEATSTPRLQLMTMHKAKGLEFDVVFLPELQRAPINNQQQLLLWQENILANDKTELLLAPIKAKDEKACLLYNFLKQREEQKQTLEATRLLYVACTRAKSSLYLLANLDKDEEKNIKAPKKRSLLDSIWPYTKTAWHYLEDEIETNEKLIVNYQRFTSSCFTKLIKTATPPSTQRCEWQNSFAKQYGTLMHLLLQQIATHGITQWQQSQQNTIIKTHAKQLYLSLNASDLNFIKSTLQAVINDKNGHWILQNHPTQFCEYALSGIIDNEVINVIIDRWFIDDKQQCWIIDYKILLNDKVNFAQEQRKYKQQLQRYCNLLGQHLQQKVHCALYFPVQRILLEVS